VSAILTGTIILFIFLLTRRFVHTDFVERLTQQSGLEVLHYATPHVKDVVPAESFFLVNPVTSIYSSEGKLLYSKGEFPIPQEWINSLDVNSSFTAELGEYTTVGRKRNVQGSTYLVFVSDKDLPGQHELDILIKTMLLGYLVSIILAYLAGLHFSGDALRPVKGVVKEVNQITKDNLSYRLKTETEDKNAIDEIGELVITFNALLSRIENAFIAQRRFVQHASHELKTPLTAILAEAELSLSRNRSIEEYKRTLDVILAETERLEQTTKGLLTLTRLEEGLYEAEIEAISIENLLNHTLSTFQLHHPDREVVKNCDSGPVEIKGNEQLLQIAILNLLDNAVKYSSDKILVNLSKSSSGNMLVLSVRDYGIGIPEKEIVQVKSPLYRASNASRVAGAGLGLSLVDRILTVHSGEFEILSKEGYGTTCIIKLPINLKV
jgi:signal transduction histidine kinase